MIKKLPWGVFAGICAIFFFYLTVAVIAAFVILNQIAAQTHTAATLFDTWWQTLIFILDIVFLIGLCGCSAMKLLQKRGGTKGENI